MGTRCFPAGEVRFPYSGALLQDHHAENGQVHLYTRPITLECLAAWGTRSPEQWYAQQFNAEAERSLHAELPPDAPRLRVSDIQAELRVQWNAMTPAEKIEATKEYLVELETARDNKKFVQHNTEKAAHEDAQMTLASIQVQVRPLSNHCANTHAGHSLNSCRYAREFKSCSLLSVRRPHK